MNSYTCIGRLGRDAELREMPNGDPVLNFSLAVNTGTRDQPGTMWFDCALFGKRGQALHQFLTKGKAVGITGKLSTKEKDNKVYVRLTVSELDLLGGKETEQKQETDFNDSIPF